MQRQAMKGLLKSCALRGVLAALVAVMPFILQGCKEKAQDRGPGAEQRAEAREEGGMAAPFILKAFGGREIRLKDYSGRLVVVNFWASWCGPCRMEANELEGAYRAFSGSGVEFIGIAVDDTEDAAKGFIKKYRLTFPMGLDKSGEISNAYRLYGIPKTILVGRDGRIIYTHTGNISGEELSEAIRKAL